jgi:hypothetical protein
MKEKSETKYLIRVHFCKPIVCQNPFPLLFVKVCVTLLFVKISFTLLFVRIHSPYVPHADDNRIGPCRVQQQRGPRDHQYQ